MASSTTSLPTQVKPTIGASRHFSDVPQDAPALEAANTIAVMVGAALVLRLATVALSYHQHLDPTRQHWHFAWEMGMVARSIAEGKGFASPYVADTGLTAWFAPAYPYLLAGIFKILGVFSKASAIAILSLNGVFSALTTIPVYGVARRVFNERVARYAGWMWVFYPYAIWVSATRIWENALTTLLLATLVWLTLLLEESDGAARWAAYGALWALAALTSPAVLAVLPCLLVWTATRRRRAGRPWLAKTALALLVLAAGIAPWMVRNYLAFARVMPLRSNFWVEMRVGNTGDTSDLYPDWAIPSTGASELARLQRVGEIQYAEQSRGEVLRFIGENPGVFAILTAKRFAYVWTGFWSLDPSYAHNEPYQIPNTISCSALTLLALAGFKLLHDRDTQWTLFVAAVLVPFPAVYYFTHPAMEYRHPIDPVLVVLVASAVACFAERCQVAEARMAMGAIPPPALVPEAE